MEKLPLPSTEYLRSLAKRKVPLPMAFVAAGGKNSDIPNSAAHEIAVVGRSNVGKSSLLNFLAGQKDLARVSRTPGRTQTINLFSVDKGRFYFVDLPGYGYAESARSVREAWQQSMEEFFRERPGLFAVVFLVDIRREVEEEDFALFHWLKSLGLQAIVVQTKADKLSKHELTPIRRKHAAALGLAPENVVQTSSDKKTGLTEFFSAIASVFENQRAGIIR